MVVDFTLEQTEDGKEITVTDTTDYTGYIKTSITDQQLTVLNLYNKAVNEIDTEDFPMDVSIYALDSEQIYDEVDAVLHDAIYFVKLSFSITKTFKEQLTFSAALVTGNTFSMLIDEHNVSVNYATSSAATLSAIASAIAALDDVASATVNGSVITIVWDDGYLPSVNAPEITGGSSQAEITMVEVSDIEDVYTEKTIITSYNLDCAIESKAGAMAKTNAEYSDEFYSLAEVTQFYDARMYREASYYLHACSQYNKAQLLLNRGLKVTKMKLNVG